MSLTALIYLALYAFGLFKTLFDRPIYGLYTYFFAFYAYAPGRWWGQDLPDLRWSLLAALVTMVALVIRSKEEKLVWFKFSENKIFLVFVLYVALQSFWALNFNVHKEYVILAIKFLCLFFIIQNCVKTDKDIVGFILINLVGSCYYSYLGMFVHTSGRLEGLGTPGMESANQLGQHMATVLIFSGYLLFCLRGAKWFIVAMLAVILLNGVFLTESRGVIIGLGGAAIFSLFLIPNFARRTFLTYALLAVFASSALVGPQLVERFKSMSGKTETEEVDKSASSRLVIVKAQLEMFLSSPIVGHGHRGTLLLSNIYIPEEYMTNLGEGQTARASHNFIMSLLVDHGLIGFSLYIMLFFKVLSKGYYAAHLKVSSDDAKLLALVLTGLAVSLVCFYVAGLGSNNKKLEIDIWIYALAPLLFERLLHLKNKRDETSKLA